MKKIKKLLAMLMAMTMVLGMGVTALAEETNPEKIVNSDPALGTAADKGTIKVKGIEANAKVYAFQIVEAVYGTDGKFTSKYNSLYTEILNDEKTNVAQEGLAEKLGTIKSGLTHNGDSWTYKEATVVPVATGTVSTDGTFTASNVPVGSYLIVVEGAENHTYAPIIVSVSYVVNNGASQVEGSSLSITSDVAWAKVIDKPTIEKTADTGNTGDTNSANVGDLVTYTVNVNPIPAYDGVHPRFNIIDTLSNGLAFATVKDVTDAGQVVEAGATQADLIKVYTVDNGKETLLSKENYTVTINNKELKVDFVKESGGTKENGYMLYDYSGQALKVVYQVKVTTDAVMNSDKNMNTAKLYYSKDSNIESENDPDDPDVPEDKTHTYTFDLSGIAEGSDTDSIVNKVGEEVDADNKKKPLPNAVFTLYTDKDCKVVYTNSHMEDGTVKSGTNGELIIKGLAAGTYYLKETAAPTGYSLNTDVYKIVITAHYRTDSDILESWDVVIENTTTGEANDGVTITGIKAGNTTTVKKLNIPNTKLTSLPSTGGIGTTIFTFGGCALMILAAALYFASRRRTAK